MGTFVRAPIIRVVVIDWGPPVLEIGGTLDFFVPQKGFWRPRRECAECPKSG